MKLANSKTDWHKYHSGIIDLKNTELVEGFINKYGYKKLFVLLIKQTRYELIRLIRNCLKHA
jgi:hypothetical protein